MVGNLAGWPEGFEPQSAVNCGDGTIYVFKETQFLTFNIASDQVVDGPLAIAGNWTDWPW